MRCFIAIDFENDLIKEITEIQRKIKKKFLFYGKFTESENLHLTLKFLGEVSEEKIGEIKKILNEIKFNEFEAGLEEIGVFSKKIPRILWLKLNGRGVFELQKEIDEKLAGLFKKEERFMGHVTIARIKKVVNKNEFFDYLKSVKIKKLNFKVKEFVLKKSELFETGPVYENICEYKLD